MTPHKQLYKHDPEAGTIGDCWRTCIACLLDRSPEDVPHIMVDCWEDSETANRKTREYLATQGLDFIEYAMSPGSSFEDILSHVGTVNPDLHYLLSGTSSNGIGHSVICCNDAIVWDTALDDSGIVAPMSDGYYWITWLVPLVLRKHRVHV